MRKRRKGRTVFDLFNVLLMLLILLVTAYPIYYVVIASFSDPQSLSRQIGLLVAPLKPYTLDAYRMVFKNQMILTGFGNTLFLVTVGLALSLILTAMGGFFLALRGPMWKNVITVMIIFTMYFSGGLVPGYLNVKDLGLFDTRWAMILPGVVSTTNMIIMKTAFQAVPDSLIESASLDGASFAQILFRIMLPLSKATLAVLALYYGVGYWNAWFNASIYIQDQGKIPLQLVMRDYLNATGEALESVAADEMAMTANLMKYALIVVGTAPIMMLYPFLQKYFVKGVMIGAVKG